MRIEVTAKEFHRVITGEDEKLAEKLREFDNGESDLIVAGGLNLSNYFLSRDVFVLLERLRRVIGHLNLAGIGRSSSASDCCLSLSNLTIKGDLLVDDATLAVGFDQSAPFDSVMVDGYVYCGDSWRMALLALVGPHLNRVKLSPKGLAGFEVMRQKISVESEDDRVRALSIKPADLTDNDEPTDPNSPEMSQTKIVT